jgi:hypothetical protein
VEIDAMVLRRSRPPFRQTINHQSFFVDRNPALDCTRLNERGTLRRIARILQRNDSSPRRYQNSGKQIERLLGTRGDDNVLGST